MIEERFGEYSQFVDLNARQSLKGVSISTIKCSYGYNHHGARCKMMNQYTSDKCVVCGQIEDWEHILKCTGN